MGTKITMNFCNVRTKESRTKYVYGKDDANNIKKKYLVMIIQNRIANKIQEAGERVKEKVHPTNYLLAKDLVQILNCFIINES